ncbi:transmembrane protein, putative [Medicago truncatula]|uniref:Transmembrane protein, putative n=1 Tax=Medicago truncatula TaxID=3880 RepID=G7K1X1_MEDTR|nr:transmembrane protein, putative [Medicago truncatula]
MKIWYRVGEDEETELWFRLKVYDKMGWGVRSNYVELSVNGLGFMQGRNTSLSLFLSLQGTLPFARGKIPVKRTKALANGTFVREKTRGRWPGKSAHRKRFARGYTPGRKTRGRTPGKRQRFLPGRTPGMSPHFRLQLSCTTDTTDTSAPALTEVTTAKNEGQSEGFNPWCYTLFLDLKILGPISFQTLSIIKFQLHSSNCLCLAVFSITILPMFFLHKTFRNVFTCLFISKFAKSHTEGYFGHFLQWDPFSSL